MKLNESEFVGMPRNRTEYDEYFGNFVMIKNSQGGYLSAGKACNLDGHFLVLNPFSDTYQKDGSQEYTLFEGNKKIALNAIGTISPISLDHLINDMEDFNRMNLKKQSKIKSFLRKLLHL